MDNSRYITEAKRVIADAERGVGIGRLNKPCRECAHYRAGNWFTVRKPTCAHPVVALAVSQADDEQCGRYLEQCEEQRANKSYFGAIVCGPNGALFEER